MPSSPLDIPAIIPKPSNLPTGWCQHVHVLQTHAGSLGTDGYGAFNLAFHVGDDAKQVHNNRTKLLAHLPDVTHIHWLEQVHGTEVVDVDHLPASLVSLAPKQGDALMTTQAGVALAIMTADCIPIVLTSQNGEQVAAIHAGWRGLAAGVVETTVKKMTHKPSHAWVGAFISQNNFEVGDDVKAAFVQLSADYEAAFSAQKNGKHMANLGYILKQKLGAHGIASCFLGGCSYGSKDGNTPFYSYRRATHAGDSKTGRMATLIYKH